MSVYKPREDSYLLEKWVSMLAEGDVLDMGTGSGIQAFAAAEKADTVLAVDKLEEAVEEVKKGAEEKNVEIEVKQSDLFKKVYDKFDVIIFNPPYLPKDEGVEDDAIYGGKEGFELTEEFLRQAKNHLKEDGFILLLFSSLTNKSKVDKSLNNHGFTWQKLDEKSMQFESLYVYKAWRE